MATFPHWDWIGQEFLSPNLKGAQGQRIAIAASRDARGQIGNLEIVYVGMHHDLHHVRQMEAGNSASWAEINDSFLGSSPGQPGRALEIAIGQNALGDGRLVLFYIGDNLRLHSNTQLIAGTAFWTGEASFGDSEATSLAVALGPDRKLEIVYGGKEGHLYHNRQKTAGSDEWVGETPFPGLKALQVAIAPNPNNQDLLEIFYIGTNHKLYHIRQLSTVMTDWTDGKDILDNDLVSQLSVGTNADGRLEVFYVGPDQELRHMWQTSTVDTTLWSVPARFPGNKANYVTAISNADGRLEIFYLDNQQGLCHNWQIVPNGTWVGETRVIGDAGLRVAGALNSDGRMEICYLGTGNHLYHNSQINANSAWNNANGAGGVSPFPNGPLVGNSNYALNNCAILTDIAVTIDIMEDVRCDSSATQTKPTIFDSTLKGYSFQLNCNSPSLLSSFQQYIIFVSHTGTELLGEFECFQGLPPISFAQNSVKLCDIPGKIPVGYQLRIILLNDDQANIIGVTFQVADGGGNMVGNKTMMLADNGVKSILVQPVTLMTLDIAGQVNGINAHFISGAGQINYASSSQMTAGFEVPPCVVFQLFGTGEQSNMTYSTVSPEMTNLLTQTFGVPIK